MTRCHRMILLVGGAAACLVGGCAGFGHEVIGHGPAKLTFDNDGNCTVPVEVKWTDDQARRESREFDVYAGWEVDLRLPKRRHYEIILRPTSTPTAAPAAGGGRRVIVVDAIGDATGDTDRG